MKGSRHVWTRLEDEMLRSILATAVIVTAVALASPALCNVPSSPGPVHVQGFWLNGTFSANPSSYGGRCGTGFFITYTGIITGTRGAHIGYRFQYGGTESAPVYMTLDAPSITVFDRKHFTTQARQPVARYDESLEILLAPVPPSKFPILWTTKVARASSQCTQFQPPQH